MDDEQEMPLVSQLHHFLINDPPFGWVRYSRRGDRVRHVIRAESVWVLTEKSIWREIEGKSPLQPVYCVNTV